MLKKGANHPKNEKDVLDPSVLDLINTIDEVKIEMKHKNNMVIAYIKKIFEMNMIMNHVNKCQSFDWPNELA